MEVLSWLIRSVPLASAAALAQMLAPSALSLRVIPSSSSTLVLAWTAVLAQIPAPTAQSFPRTNFQGIHKNLVSFTLARFFVFILFSPTDFPAPPTWMAGIHTPLAGAFVFLYNGIDNNRKR